MWDKKNIKLKMIQKIKKKCKRCGKEFVIYKTTDRYCSRNCYFRDARKEQIKSDKRKKKVISVIELDLLFCQAVKKKAGYKSEIPNDTGTRLEVHHFYGKKAFPHLRHEIENGIYISSDYHTQRPDSAHESPLKFKELIIKIRGQEWYNRLRGKAFSKALERGKIDREAKKLELLKFLKSLEEKNEKA